jgi:hypothetical protein
MVNLANPTAFVDLTRRVLPWLVAATAVLFVACLWQAPPWQIGAHSEETDNGGVRCIIRPRIHAHAVSPGRRAGDGLAGDRGETLLLEAFRALDQMPHSPHVRALLRREEGGVYARLAAIPDDPYVDMGPEAVAPLPDFDGPQRHFSEVVGH